MKITYFGTAAAEGTPALFCYCEVCEKARKSGGRNIRTRSQAMINDDLLIDFPADTYMHMLNYGLDLKKIKACLITHGHDDHLYPYDFVYRMSPVYAHYDGEKEVPMDILITKKSSWLLNKCFRDEKLMLRDPKAIKITYAKKFKKYNIAGYEITALKAEHKPTLDPVFYIIKKDDKTVLYAHDTGFFSEKTWDYIEKSGIVFDFVSLDCTSTHDDNAFKYHMGFNACCSVKKRLLENNANENTIFCLNHFSHNGGYTYDELVPIAEKEGFIVSYDGMEIEF